MDIMNRADFMEAGINAVTGTMQFLTGKMQEVQERAAAAKTAEEQAEVIADVKQILIMLTESKAELQDVYDMMQNADQLPEVIDLDTFDMTPYRARQQKYEAMADAYALILDM